MKTKSLLIHAVAVLLALSAQAETLKIKLGTILPRGVQQEIIVRQLAEDWGKASGGTVVLKIAPGAQKDGEAGIVRKLHSRNYQAGLLSATGLSEIEKDVTALQFMPLVFRDWDEVDFVRNQIRDELEAELRAKGYVTLLWADAGWVNFFSNKPATTPEDFKKLKMFCWGNNPKEVAIIRSLGYHSVGLETDAIHSSFASKMIECAPLPPAFALGLQIQTVAPYVVEVKWAPIVGAMVIREDVWNEIPAALQEKLLTLSRKAGEDLRKEGRRFHDGTMAAWRKRPEVHVHTPTADDQALWDELGAELGSRVRGSMVPASIYDEVMRLLHDYRAAKPSE